MRPEILDIDKTVRLQWVLNLWSTTQKEEEKLLCSLICRKLSSEDLLSYIDDLFCEKAVRCYVFILKESVNEEMIYNTMWLISNLFASQLKGY